MGTGFSLGWSKAGYYIKSDIGFYENSNKVELTDTIKDLLEALGVSEVGDKGFESMIDTFDWNMRLYGGLSINMFVVKLDFTGMYNLRDSSLGATLGLRFQL
ncbi:MAG: hypothetical protein FWD24_00795 [Treponema sp.]|nr:hypothetical protein [Treponema sp.]